jgi:hypothetical protein
VAAPTFVEVQPRRADRVEVVLPSGRVARVSFQGMMADVVTWSRSLGDDEPAEWNRLTTC